MLAALGMKDAFTESADLSGMGGRPGDLYISAVIHKAFVEVNEEGTEAAAATAVAVEVTSISMDEPPEFRADRPFLFIIRENKTGSVLFIGRLADPTAAGA
jgi:serpin B